MLHFLKFLPIVTLDSIDAVDVLFMTLCDILKPSVIYFVDWSVLSKLDESNYNSLFGAKFTFFFFFFTQRWVELAM